MLSAEPHRGNREATAEESYGRFLYNLHRYYDPAIGRYISADPIGQDALIRPANDRVAGIPHAGFGGALLSDLPLQSPRPLGFDSNLFAYVGGNPLNWVDPLGLFSYSPTAGNPVNQRTANAIDCFEKCVGSHVTVTGAQETGPPHKPGSAHETGEACDIGKNSNPGLDRPTAEKCFTKCSGPHGFVYGQEEKDHYHFQTRPGKNKSTGFAPGIR